MIRSTPLPQKPAHESRAGFWDQNLGYPHAILTILTALTLGMAFHAWVGYKWLELLPAAAILGVAVVPLLSIAVAARLRPGAFLVKWITGVPFAMVSCSAVGFLAVAGGVAPQSFWETKLGLQSVWASWPFLFATYLMMANLVGSCGRRAWPLTYTNVVYQATHLGLAVALGGGAFSSLSIERRTMVLFKGMPTQTAMDIHNREYTTPFTVELKDFRMDVFPPTLTLVQLDEKMPDGMSQTPGQNLMKAGMRETVGGYQLTVEKYIDHAAFDGLHWRQVAWKTAAPAALVAVKGPSGKVKRGWISSGSPETTPAYLQLGDNRAVFMNMPRPKKFESDIRIDGKDYRVGVNKPVHVAGVDVYQFSYDEKLGAASQYSVVEVVRDRGLPVVYAGIFLMLFGSVLHLWNGVGGRK